MVDVGFTDPPPRRRRRSKGASDEPRHSPRLGRRARGGPDRPDHRRRRSTSADRHAGADRARRRVLGDPARGVPAARRRATAARSTLTVVVLVAALVWTVVGGPRAMYGVTFAGAVAVDAGDLRHVGRAAGAGPAVGAADGRPGRPSRAGRSSPRRPPRSAPPATGVAARVAAPMQTEVFPLALFAVGGMMVFPAATDLVTLFVALEVLSLPLYLMCGLARRRRLISQESAVKYFLLGAFTSAIFVYGLALLYGYSGSTAFVGHRHPGQGGRRQRRAAARRASRWCWSACCSRPRSARSTCGRRTSTRARRPRSRRSWRPAPRSPRSPPCCGSATSRWSRWPGPGSRWSGSIAGASMVIGSVIGITQTDMKRMLAYSSVAHAGFILLGVLAMSESGASATMFYLLTYGMATIGAFAILTLVRKGDGEASHVSDWAGPGQAVAGARRVDEPVPAVVRRHPADRRVHRQAQRVHRRDGVRVRLRWWCWRWSPRPSPRSSTCGSSWSCTSPSPVGAAGAGRRRRSAPAARSRRRGGAGRRRPDRWPVATEAPVRRGARASSRSSSIARRRARHARPRAVPRPGAGLADRSDSAAVVTAVRSRAVRRADVCTARTGSAAGAGR